MFSTNSVSSCRSQYRNHLSNHTGIPHTPANDSVSSGIRMITLGTRYRMIWKAFLVTYIVSSSISFSSVLLVAVELAEELLPSRWFTSSSPARSISRSPSESSCCGKNRKVLKQKHSAAPWCTPKSYEETLCPQCHHYTAVRRLSKHIKVRFFSCNLEVFLW